MRHTTQHTTLMLRRIAEELEQAEQSERDDAQFRAEQEQRSQEETDRRADERSIAQSLRQIEQHLAHLVHNQAFGTTVIGKGR